MPQASSGANVMRSILRPLNLPALCALLVLCAGVLAEAAPPAPAAGAEPAPGTRPEGAAAEPAPAHGAEHVTEKGLSAQAKDPKELRGDLAVWTLLVFLIVLAVLWKTAWKPILAGLKKREDQIAENIAAAQRQHDEARRLLEQYERKLSGAASQVREIMEEARRDAEHTQQEIIARARAEAQTEKNRTLVEIDTARQQALKDIAEKSTDMAIDLAGRIVRAKLSPADHRELIQEAVGRLAKGSPSRN